LPGYAHSPSEKGHSIDIGGIVKIFQFYANIQVPTVKEKKCPPLPKRPVNALMEKLSLSLRTIDKESIASTKRRHC
jgi:hypothetical protein